MQYMHIAPFTREAAVRLLDEPEAITTRPHHGSRGELGATEWRRLALITLAFAMVARPRF
jgi:hypothetical protein